MKISLQQLKPFLKIIFFTLLILLPVISCSDDTENERDTNISKLYAMDGIGSDLKIVEINPISGDLESIFLKFVPKQARVYFDFTYFKPTNELMIRENVFEDGIGPQLIKVDIDTKEWKTINSEDFFITIVAGNYKLFALKDIFGNKYSRNLVEINPENTSTISTLETFETLENSPEKYQTGISYMLYSYDTNELLIPKRTSLVTNSNDDLIKINVDSGNKTIIPINSYESITVGKNGRLFAIKKTYNSNLGKFTFFGVVEVDANNGNEIDILKEFDNQNTFWDSEIIFLSETNEILVDIGTLHKINVDTKTESILKNDNSFYSYRSVNIY